MYVKKRIILVLKKYITIFREKARSALAGFHMGPLNLSCPHYKRCTGGWTFTVRKIQEWNKLNVDLKRSLSTKHFKGSLFKSNLKNQFTTQSFISI